MRESTGVWLEPMFNEAEKRGISVIDLTAQATMPAAEADSQVMNWMASYTPAGARSMALDWIRLGQLLRERLGWDHYPEWPEDAPGA